MSLKKRFACHAAGLCAGSLGLLAQAQPALAQSVDCSTLQNPVFVAGSTAVKPFLAKVAGALASLMPPVTVVYAGLGSCVGVAAMATSPATAAGNVGVSTGVYWNPDATEVTGGCALQTTATPVDIGVSDVYASSCPDPTTAAGVKDFYGPIQAMTFAVPIASTKQVVSAEAAYLLMGFGNDGGTPWTDITQVQGRSASSGTQQMLAAAIGVPAAKWLAKANSGSGDVVNGLVASTSPDLALGILATDVVDKNRTKVRSLAYQHYGQNCGYTPDSDPIGSFDKKNVRDGHYAVWGPLHLLTPTNAAGVPANPNAKLVIDYLSLAPTVSEAVAKTLIETEAKGGVVPDCAMRVTRASEVGPMMSYMPAKSCECIFLEKATGSAPVTCTACTTSATCPATAPACNFGYCEVQ